MTNQTNHAAHFASLEYRRAATQQASVVGLVIALHDTLIGDLKRAADAMERNDIETRCDQLIHGFKVLTQLDAMLDRTNGGETALRISRFYSHVRSQMLAAQFKLDSAILHQQIRIVHEVREAWQQVDSAPLDTGNMAANSYSTPAAMQPATEPAARISFSC